MPVVAPPRHGLNPLDAPGKPGSRPGRHVAGSAIQLARHCGAALFLALAAPAAAETPALLPPPDRPPPARVQLDRLKWAPDGAALAVEARFLDGADTAIDTLVIDLTEGSLHPASPQAMTFALSADEEQLAVASRYAIWCGPAGRTVALVPLQRLDPTTDLVERLGFNAAGDTLFVALRRAGGRGST